MSGSRNRSGSCTSWAPTIPTTRPASRPRSVGPSHSREKPVLTLGNVAIDCSDAAALASFYATLLDRPVDPGASEYFATIGRGATTPVLMFLKVPDRTPGKNSVHLDLHTDTL